MKRLEAIAAANLRHDDYLGMCDAIRAESRPLVLDLLRTYETADDSAREEIRELFGRYPKLTWCSAPEARDHRLHLIWLSATERYHDPRDVVVMTDELTKQAVTEGIDIAPILDEVAAMSSDVSRGIQSTRRAMLDARARIAQ